MTYTIEIAVDQTEAEQFRDWLIAQGHAARVGRTTRTSLTDYVADDEGEILENLWTSYCNA